MARVLEMAVVRPTTSPPEEKRPTAGFVISLIAGILILINGLSVSVLGFLGISISVLGVLSVSVLRVLGILRVLAVPLLGAIVMPLAPVFGILVIVGAVLMYRGPTTAGGVLVILFGLLSIVIGGGFIIGTILAIVGGALGLAGR